jgi:3-oxoacyl-[acyl-carrier protein] reductase
VALVTGGATGIGLAVARSLHAGGLRVAVTHRSTPLPDDLPDDVLPVPCDVGDPGAVDGAFDAVEARLGPVGVLVAGAGATDDGLAVRMAPERFDAVLRTNLTGSFLLARRALGPMMRNRWGRIVFLGSVVAATGQAGQANYAASKAGLVGLARSLAREYAGRNVTVNVVAPGPIDTGMLQALPDATRQAIVAAVPVGRTGTPEEVASAVSYLVGDAAAYTTGIVLPVDGGLGMGAW